MLVSDLSLQMISATWYKMKSFRCEDGNDEFNFVHIDLLRYFCGTNNWRCSVDSISDGFGI
jgi:hypothetical protein